MCYNKKLNYFLVAMHFTLKAQFVYHLCKTHLKSQLPIGKKINIAREQKATQNHVKALT